MARQVSDEEFSEFVHGAWPGLYRTAYLLLGDPGLAEDLVQTALAKTYAAWPRCATCRPPPATPARRCSTPPRRGSASGRGATSCRPSTCPTPDGRPTRRTGPPCSTPSPPAAAPARRGGAALLRGPVRRRDGHALGCSEGTVKSQTSKALDTLRGCSATPSSPSRRPNWEAPMTERLSALLHEEADRLHVPMPAAGETLAAGRRVRRRRRVTQGLTAVVVVAAIGRRQRVPRRW